MGLVANLGQPVVAMPPRDDDSTPRRARLATPSLPPSSEIVRDHDLRSLRKLAKRKRREEKEEEEKARCSE